jgi:hypothetical protein
MKIEFLFYEKDNVPSEYDFYSDDIDYIIVVDTEYAEWVYENFVYPRWGMYTIFVTELESKVVYTIAHA